MVGRAGGGTAVAPARKASDLRVGWLMFCNVGASCLWRVGGDTSALLPLVILAKA